MAVRIAVEEQILAQTLWIRVENLATDWQDECKRKVQPKKEKRQIQLD